MPLPQWADLKSAKENLTNLVKVTKAVFNDALELVCINITAESYGGEPVVNPVTAFYFLAGATLANMAASTAAYFASKQAGTATGLSVASGSLTTLGSLAVAAPITAINPPAAFVAAAVLGDASGAVTLSEGVEKKDTNKKIAGVMTLAADTGVVALAGVDLEGLVKGAPDGVKQACTTACSVTVGASAIKSTVEAVPAVYNLGKEAVKGVGVFCGWVGSFWNRGGQRAGYTALPEAQDLEAGKGSVNPGDTVTETPKL